MELLRIQGKNRAAPLLSESGGQLRLGDGTGLKKPIAEASDSSVALQTKSFAQLGRGDGAAIHQQKAERQAIGARLVEKKTRKQPAEAIFEERMEARKLAIPATIEEDSSRFVETSGPEFAFVRAIRTGAAGNEAVPPTVARASGEVLVQSLGNDGNLAGTHRDLFMPAESRRAARD
jgi:hypothetical protein